MNERINLLDQNKDTGPSDFLKRLHTMRLVTVGLLFIVSVSSVILFILVTLSPLPALQQKEKTLEQTLSQSKNDIVKLALVNNQTDAVNGLLKKRGTLDVPLGQVLTKMPGDMQVTEIRTDSKNMLLTVASPSLQSFNTFLNALVGFAQDKKFFNKVTLTEMTIDTSNNTYNATVQLSLL